jgi:hypothetical protein
MDPHMEMKIKEFFKESYKNRTPPKEIKQSSVDMYIRDSTRLLKGLGEGYDVKDLVHMGLVDKWLNEEQKNGKQRSDATKRNYYSAILVMCQSYDLDKEVCDQYAKIRDELNVKLAQKKDEEKLTPNQKENMVERAEILGAIAKLDEKVRKQPIGLIADHRDLVDLQMLTLLRLYESIPSRNEIGELLYMPKVLYDGMGDDHPKNMPKVLYGMGDDHPNNVLYDAMGDDHPKNYLVHDKDDPHIPFMISLNDYKTSNHHGARIFPITQESPWGMTITAYLHHLLKRRGLGFHRMETDFNDQDISEEEFTYAINGTPVFYTNWNAGKFRPMTKHDLTRKFTKFFKDSIGKSISTTLLAKSLYEEEVGAEMSKKLRELALARGHSVNTALAHYV